MDEPARLQGPGRGRGHLAEIARETGHDWRTVKRHLSADVPATPSAPAKRGPGPRLIDPYAHLIDAWLRKQPKLKASVVDDLDEDDEDDSFMGLPRPALLEDAALRYEIEQIAGQALDEYLGGVRTVAHAMAREGSSPPRRRRPRPW